MVNYVQLQQSVLSSMQESINQAAGAMVREMLESLPATDILAISAYLLQAVHKSEEIPDKDQESLSFFIMLFVELIRTISKAEQKKVRALIGSPTIAPILFAQPTPKAEEPSDVEMWLTNLNPNAPIADHVRVESLHKLQAFIQELSAEGDKKRYINQLLELCHMLDISQDISQEARTIAYSTLFDTLHEVIL